VIATLIIGLIAGGIAKLLTPGSGPGGWVVTILLGIGGSWLSGMLGRTLGWYQPGQGAGLIGSTVGALIILFIYNRMASRRGTTAG
jgi:uncharacterized membrane protein YeaQ/YmgE (transglycosylase-associated protein family)